MDPEIIKVTADVDDFKKALDEVDKRFEQTEDAAKGLGETTEATAKKSARTIDEVTAALKREEAEQRRLSKLIIEQEKITAEFKQEMIRLTAEWRKLGKDGTMAGQKVGKQMRSLQDAIKDQTISVQSLRKQQANQKDVVKGLKDEEKQLKDNDKQLNKNEKSVGTLESKFNALAQKVAAAFAVERIIAFGKEAIIAADRAAGIEIAFDRIGISVLELRAATKGAVSDVELMRSAVNAKNLGVPVEELAGLLGFAASRARETGETVDSLVNSIVTGLGRKSTMILDNLGISSIELKKELGDVALESASVVELTEALNRVIEKQGGISSGAASGVQSLGASWDNYTVAVGKAISASSYLGSVSQEIQNISDVTERWGFWQGVLSIAAGDYNELGEEARIAKGYIDGVAAAQQKIVNELEQMNKELAKDLGFGEQAGIVEQLKEQIDLIDKQIETAPSQDKINELLRKRIAIQKQLTDATTLAVTGLVATTQERLKLINDEIATTGSQKRLNELSEEKLRIETELNAILNQRKNIQSFEEDQTEQLDLDQSFFDIEGKKLDAAKTTNEAIEKSVDALYDAELEAQRAAYDEKRANDRALADYQIEQQQRVSAANIQTISNMFATFKLLAGENAEAVKAISIFEAIVNAYVAITSVLKDPLLPTVAKIPLATSIGALAFAQVAKIQSTDVPSYYTGTDFVRLNGNKPGRDTVPAMLNEGEGVVTTNANKQWRGVVKAMNAGNFDQYITAKHVQPALKALKKEQEREKTALLTAAIKGTVNAKLSDNRIVSELRRNRRVTEEMAYLISKGAGSKNPYRR